MPPKPAVLVIADYLLGVVPRGARGEELRCALRQYKGRSYIDVRCFFPDEHDVMCPSKKGVMLRPRELPEVLALLTRAAALANGKMLAATDVPGPYRRQGQANTDAVEVVRRPDGNLIVRETNRNGNGTHAP